MVVKFTRCEWERRSHKFLYLCYVVTTNTDVSRSYKIYHWHYQAASSVRAMTLYGLYVSRKHPQMG